MKSTPQAGIRIIVNQKNQFLSPAGMAESSSRPSTAGADHPDLALALSWTKSPEQKRLIRLLWAENQAGRLKGKARGRTGSVGLNDHAQIRISTVLQSLRAFRGS